MYYSMFLRSCAIFIASSTNSVVISFVSTHDTIFLETGPLHLSNKQNHHPVSICRLYLYTMVHLVMMDQNLFLRYFSTFLKNLLILLFLSTVLYNVLLYAFPAYNLLLFSLISHVLFYSFFSSL